MIKMPAGTASNAEIVKGLYVSNNYDGLAASKAWMNIHR